MAFSGKLVEPTKLDKITLRQAAISFNKGKKNICKLVKYLQALWPQYTNIKRTKLKLTSKVWYY